MAKLMRLDTKARANLYARFVLSNRKYPSDTLIEEGAALTPRVLIDCSVWVADAAARFQLEDNKRGTREWDIRARTMIEAAIRKSKGRLGNDDDDDKKEYFDAICTDADGRCLFPVAKMPSYEMILRATAGLVCIDASSSLVEAKFSQRPLNSMVITSAMVAEAWIEYFQRQDKDTTVRDLRIHAILDASIDRLRKDVGAKWVWDFLAIDVKDNAGVKARAWLRSPVTWYAMAASYNGYGYALNMSTARVSQAYAVLHEDELARDSTAAFFRTPQRVPPDWLEVYIMETIFQMQAPADRNPKDFVKAKGAQLVYKTENEVWKDLEEKTIVDDAEASHAASTSNGHHLNNDFDYAQVAAQETRKRKRAREASQLQEDAYADMSWDEVLADCGA